VRERVVVSGQRGASEFLKGGDIHEDRAKSSVFDVNHRTSTLQVG
jgi:hypothetical protein